MVHSYFLQLSLVILLIFAFTSAQDSSYEFESNESNEQQEDSLTNLSDTYNTKIDESNERKDHRQRSILGYGSQNRQQLIDLLRKAYSQGWKPNLKHYIPATRFGRHL